MKARDRYRFIEQTLFFETASFASEYHEEARSHVEDHVLRLRRLHPKVKFAFALEKDCDGEAYFCLLMYVPEDCGISAFRNQAEKLWQRRHLRNGSFSRSICPVDWLEEIACSPFSQMLHVDDAIWCAYYFRMDRECWSPEASNIR